MNVQNFELLGGFLRKYGALGLYKPALKFAEAVGRKLISLF